MTQCAVIGCKLKQNVNEGSNSCASIAGLVLSFIACLILLVIAPLRFYFLCTCMLVYTSQHVVDIGCEEDLISSSDNLRVTQ